MAPSVVYCDDVDQVFMIVNKKKKAPADAPVRIKEVLAKAIDQVKRGPEATEFDRILFIGCSSKPYTDTVDRKKMFDAFGEKVWVSYPEYGSRVLLWQQFMDTRVQEHLKTLAGPQAQSEPRPNVVAMPLAGISTLARLSEGYTAGSIKQTLERVLTIRRVQQMNNRPLRVQEFLGPLSRTAYCWPKDFDEFQKFDFEATGEKKAKEDRDKEAERLEAEAAKNQKKK